MVKVKSKLANSTMFHYLETLKDTFSSDKIEKVLGSLYNELIFIKVFEIAKHRGRWLIC